MAFIIDKSGSIRHEKFGDVQTFINLIIEQLEVQLLRFLPCGDPSSVGLRGSGVFSAARGGKTQMSEI